MTTDNETRCPKCGVPGPTHGDITDCADAQIVYYLEERRAARRAAGRAELPERGAISWRVLILGCVVGVLAWVGIILGVVAVANAQTLTIVNHAGIGARDLARAERAVQAQANGPLRGSWHSPVVRFGRGGERVTLVPPYQLPGGCGCIGYHDYQGGRAFAYVGVDEAWTVTLSHEILEMVVDPRIDHFINGPVIGYPEYGTVQWLVEAADPVEDLWYGRVPLSDFPLPAWYTGHAGPWDRLGILPGAQWFSRPTGYAYFVSGGSWYIITANRHGGRATISAIRPSGHGARASVCVTCTPVAR